VVGALSLELGTPCSTPAGERSGWVGEVSRTRERNAARTGLRLNGFLRVPHSAYYFRVSATV
jgi:hypothetical protein